MVIYPGPNPASETRDIRSIPLLPNVEPCTKPSVGIDTTYIPLQKGWMYMVAVIDWYSRYIVDWELSDSLYTGVVIDTVQRALQKAKPDIINSDLGCQFTSDTYIGLLKENAVQISMNGKGRALDNIITERFWRTLKAKEVY